MAAYWQIAISYTTCYASVLSLRDIDFGVYGGSGHYKDLRPTMAEMSESQESSRKELQ